MGLGISDGEEAADKQNVYSSKAKRLLETALCGGVA
jgi:hypothetical protein